MNKWTRIAVICVLLIVVVSILFIKQRGNTSSVTQKADISSESEQKKSLPQLIDLGADKCIPCKMMAPILEELEKEYDNQFEVVFIDVWKNPDAAKPYKIKLIPTQIFYDKNGEEKFRHEGFYSKEDILAKWKELGVGLTEPTQTEI